MNVWPPIAPLTPADHFGRPDRVRCWRCEQEMGELAAIWTDGALEAMCGLCPTHYAETPSVLRQALRENPIDATGATLSKSRARWQMLYEEVELEASAQWTEILGCPVYPGDRVDALDYLRGLR